MKGFYPSRTCRILPICILLLVAILFFLFSFIIRYEEISVNAGTICFLCSVVVIPFLLLIPVGMKADAEGIYINNDSVIWKRITKTQSCAIKDIKGIVILHNITQKAVLGTTVPVYETVQTNYGKQYIYSIVLVNDLTDVNFNYSSNHVFIRDNKSCVVGCAIYNQTLINYLLTVNKNIKIIQGNIN